VFFSSSPHAASSPPLCLVEIRSDAVCLGAAWSFFPKHTNCGMVSCDSALSCRRLFQVLDGKQEVETLWFRTKESEDLISALKACVDEILSDRKKSASAKKKAEVCAPLVFAQRDAPMWIAACARVVMMLCSFFPGLGLRIPREELPGAGRRAQVSAVCYPGVCGFWLIALRRQDTGRRCYHSWDRRGSEKCRMESGSFEWNFRYPPPGNVLSYFLPL